MPSHRSIDHEAAGLMATIESNADPAARASAMRALAERRTADACRILIDTYHRAFEPDVRTQLLDAIARSRHERGVEFLLRLARQRRDAEAARAAVKSLGRTDSMLAGDYLVSLLWQADHFVREAIDALAQLRGYPAAATLAVALHAALQTERGGIVAPLVSALGSRGITSHWSLIEDALSWARPRPEWPAVRTAAIAAACALGGPTADAWLDDIADDADGDPTVACASLHRSLRPQVPPYAAYVAIEQAPDNAERWRWVQCAAQDAEATLQWLPEAQPTAGAWVRAAWASSSRAADDAAWFRTRAARAHPDAIAALAIAYRDAAVQTRGLDVAQLPVATCVEVWKRMRDPRSTPTLVEIAQNVSLSSSVRVDAINALVAQAQVEPTDTDHRRRAVDGLVTLYQARLPERLQARVIRALGQVDAPTDDIVPSWLDTLATRAGSQNHRSSIAFALSLHQSPAAGQALLEALRRLLAERAPDAELEPIVVAMAHAQSKLPDDAFAPLPAAPAPSSVRAQRALLRVLAKHTWAGHEAFIAAGLASDDPAEALLAVAAAGRNFAPALREPLMLRLRDSNHALAHRSRDWLARHPDPQIGCALIDHLERADAHPDEAIAVLQSLRPEDSESAKALAERLDRALRKGLGAFGSPDVAELGATIRTALEVEQFRAEAPAQSQASPHAASMPAEWLLPEPARAVLRNAELTVDHADLFHDAVDKSTAIVEYVKAIDLMLQDHLGRDLFVGTRSPDGDTLLDRVRQRAIELGLDDESVAAADVLDKLDARPHFDEQTLPAYKLAALCRAMARHKIQRAPYRYVDGLRAWGLLLLVFGRRFEHDGRVYEPLLPVESIPPDRVAHLAAQLNALQELRNHSAHRGTLMQRPELDATRRRCIEVLEELEQLLAGRRRAA